MRIFLSSCGIKLLGAEDEIRTRDPRLGKAMLYHWATSAYLVRVEGLEPPVYWLQVSRIANYAIPAFKKASFLALIIFY